MQAWARHLLAAGRTTKQLAGELGCSQPAVSRIATGKTAMLRPEATLRLIVLAGGRVELPQIPANDTPPGPAAAAVAA